jgi:hypothetical protein
MRRAIDGPRRDEQESAGGDELACNRRVAFCYAGGDGDGRVKTEYLVADGVEVG